MTDAVLVVPVGRCAPAGLYLIRALQRHLDEWETAAVQEGYVAGVNSVASR